MDFEFFGQVQFGVELCRNLEGLIFGVDQGEVTVRAAGAGHGSSRNLAGLQREALQQGVGLESIELSAGKSHHNHVLIFGESNFTIAVLKACTGQILQVFCR